MARPYRISGSNTESDPATVARASVPLAAGKTSERDATLPAGHALLLYRYGTVAWKYAPQSWIERGGSRYSALAPTRQREAALVIPSSSRSGLTKMAGSVAAMDPTS